MRQQAQQIAGGNGLRLGAGFKDTPLDGLVFKILEQVVRKSNLDPQLVEDICLGNVCCNP